MSITSISSSPRLGRASATTRRGKPVTRSRSERTSFCKEALRHEKNTNRELGLVHCLRRDDDAWVFHGCRGPEEIERPVQRLAFPPDQLRPRRNHSQAILGD